MIWLQQSIYLRPRPRGFHLVTAEILEQLPDIAQIKTGLLHLLLQHTSASLSLNENADPTVRSDLEALLNKLAPENAPYYQHTLEGSDDMPAHIKSALLGVTLTLSITDGRVNLGTWQGIYLGEHRNHGGKRTVIATLQGQGR